MAGTGYSTNSRFCRNSRMEWVGKYGAKGPFNTSGKERSQWGNHFLTVKMSQGQLSVFFEAPVEILLLTTSISAHTCKKSELKEA